MSTATDLAALAQHLQQSAVTALETMCFVGVLGPIEGGPEEDTVSASVSFRGDAEGALHITLSRDAALNAASCFLGEDAEDVPADRMTSVIGELANVICGSMLSAYGPSGSFYLDAPLLGEPPTLVGVNTVKQSYELEAGTMALRLDVR